MEERHSSYALHSLAKHLPARDQQPSRRKEYREQTVGARDGIKAPTTKRQL